MPYQATVIPVMIASPSDVREYRSLARDVVEEWNFVHSLATNAVLMPVGWETHSSPELGASPQDLINDRILEGCDLLVGIFWTRLGTPTGKAASGSVEEIERHLKAGKPAMVYFCEAPASLETLDFKQREALNDFRKWCQSKGLIETFTDLHDFRAKFHRHLPIALRKNPYLKGLLDQLPANGGFGVPSIQRGPSNPIADLSASLIDEARTLIKEAAIDANGRIFKISIVGGRSVRTNAKNFGDSGDGRSSARWEHALGQLIDKSLVSGVGVTGGSFQMSELGYQVADFINSQAAHA